MMNMVRVRVYVRAPYKCPVAFSLPFLLVLLLAFPFPLQTHSEKIRNKSKMFTFYRLSNTLAE